MFIHNIDPVIVNIGSVAIHWYSIPYLLGFLLVYLWLRNAAKKKLIDLSIDDVQDILIYLMLGVIVGSRLGILLWDPLHYLKDPLAIFRIWEGGMSFHGGLVGIIIAGWLYTKKKKNITLLELGDILVIPALIGLALGRVANFINGELWGTLTDRVWCVVFPGADGCRHPAQLYDGLGRTLALGALLLLQRMKYKSGFLLWNFVFLVGLSRFVTDFWRIDLNTLGEPIKYVGLSLGQWYSLAMIIPALYILIKNYKNDFKNFFSHPED